MFNPGYVFKSTSELSYVNQKSIGKGGFGTVYLVQRVSDLEQSAHREEYILIKN
jgi:serine/threonine protein kinase